MMPLTLYNEGEKLPLFGDLKRFAEPPSIGNGINGDDYFATIENGKEDNEQSDKIIDDASKNIINRIVKEVVLRETNIHNDHFDTGKSFSDRKSYSFKCRYCKIDQHSLEGLRLHMQSESCQKLSNVINKGPLYNAENLQSAEKGNRKLTGRTSYQKEEFTCNYCEYKIFSRADYRMHLQAVHNLGISPTSSKQPTEKQCPICEYKSSQKVVLDNHIRIVHLELQQIEENNDDQSSAKSNFGNQDSLKLKDPQVRKSRKINSPDKIAVNSGAQNSARTMTKDKIRCPQCEFQANEKDSLDEHIQAEHTKMRNVPYAIVYACVECDYGALDADILRKHMKAVHYQQRKDSHSANGVENMHDKEDARSDSIELNTEEESKIEDSNLACLNCDFSTSLRTEFSQHVNSQCVGENLGNKNGYPCHLCKFSATKNYILKAHIEEYHEQVVNPDVNDIKPIIKLEKPKGEVTSKKPSQVVNEVNGLDKKIKTFCSECGFHSSNAKKMQDHDLTAHSEKPIYRPIKKKDFTILKLVEPKRSRKEISVETMTLKEMFKEIKHVFDSESQVWFECPLCSHQIAKTGRTSKGNMNTHIRRRHYNIRNSSCTECEYSAFNRQSLDNHTKQVHEKVKNFRCSYDECEFRAFNITNLASHVKSVHTKIKDIQCPRCSYKTTNSANLYQHIKGRHNKIKDKACDYDGCDFKATLGGDLKRHIKAVHMRIRLACPYCEHTAPYEAGLQAHIKCVHEQVEKDIICELCGYATHQDSKLQKHIKLVHEACKSLVCDVCLRYSSDDYRKLKRHMRLRHNKTTTFKRQTKVKIGKKKKKIKNNEGMGLGNSSVCLDWA